MEDVDYLKGCGVRAVALTWNNTNLLAGGVHDPDAGLTEFGRAVVRRMEDSGILVDVSHLSDKSFYDVARIAREPIVATHSNSRTICPHPRNLTDDMFKIINDSGGCTGINLYPLFLTENSECTSKDALKHIEHFISLGGIDAIGIGADFDGTNDSLPQDLQGCEEVCRLLELIDNREYIDKISHKNFLRVFKGVD